MVRMPEKELRFTRSRQAAGYGLLGAVFFGAGVTLAATLAYRDPQPEISDGLWATVFFVLSFACMRLARYLVRHAYLILTPLGLEIFPFFFPAKNMRMVLWQEILDAEVSKDGKWLTLHFTSEKTSGLHLSLRPIQRKFRCLLAKAVLGRVSRQGI
jgi:hypothetical protein